MYCHFVMQSAVLTHGRVTDRARHPQCRCQGASYFTGVHCSLPGSFNGVFCISWTRQFHIEQPTNRAKIYKICLKSEHITGSRFWRTRKLREWSWGNFPSRSIWRMQLRVWKPSRTFTYRATGKTLYSGLAKESRL